MELDWLNINPTSGGTGQTDVYVSVTENTAIGSTRSATVRFTNEEGLTADLNLSQGSDTSDMRFVVTPDYIFVPGGGGTFYVNVLTNTYWKVSDYNPSLTITTENIDGYGDGVLTITFPPNPNTNNQYGYDYYGRPFYGREGYITVSSVMGQYQIFWEQAAYEAITVAPKKLIFPQSGGSKTVTVKSSTDWTLTSYDSATTTISPISGHNGETVVTVTKQPLTQAQIDYYVTVPSTAIFSDGSNTAVLSISSTIDDYFIDDDYVTITYYVPEDKVDKDMFLFRWITGRKEYYYENGTSYYNVIPLGYVAPSEVLFQDQHNTGTSIKADPVTWQEVATQAYFTKFTTPGYHQIKYKFPDNTLITKYMFEFSKDIVKVVVGNDCNGTIDACSVRDVTNCEEVILGLGTITLIGEAAFSGCGSYDKDFILPNGVKNMQYCPFTDFKSKKFIFDMDYWGGDNASETKTTQSFVRYDDSGFRWFNVFIYGNSFGPSSRLVGSSSYYKWSKNPGPFSCTELVFGQNVKMMYSNGIYPYGFVRSSTSERETIWYSGIMYSFTVQTAPITCSTITMLGKTPPQTPSGINENMTRTRHTFTLGYSDVHNYDFGFSPGSKPFHYPVGSDYSAWLSTFTNNYGDIDI